MMKSAITQLKRVRRICLGLPETTEKLSHGEPHFFVGKKLFVAFDDHHHGADHLAVWLPVPPGAQVGIIASNPGTFFKPPYVGVRGWVGIELDRITDEDLRFHIEVAWELVQQLDNRTGRIRRNGLKTKDRVRKIKLLHY